MIFIFLALFGVSDAKLDKRIDKLENKIEMTSVMEDEKKVMRLTNRMNRLKVKKSK